MKKTTFTTILLMTILIAVAFISFKFYLFNNLKNDCIKNSIKPDGYSMILYFEPNTIRSDVDRLISQIRKIPEVKNVETKSSSDAWKDFMKENDVAHLAQILNESPLESSVIISSSINDIEPFLDLEKDILEQVRNSHLGLSKYTDGNMALLKKELTRVKEAPLLKDFTSYLFTRDSQHFFEKYGLICMLN